MERRFLGSRMTITDPVAHSTEPLAIVRFDNLTLGYNRHPAVHHLTADIASGSLLAVVGPNGAGKSTLLKGIVGELRPMQGAVHLSGASPEGIAYLPQLSTLDTTFPIVIRDFVSMGLWREFGAFKGLNSSANQLVDAALGAVGLAGLEKRPIGQVSGGQLQRARFAQVILQESPLVLLDEPYAAIDVSTMKDLAQIIALWNGEGRTIISVLHDLEHVRQSYPETLLLCREKVAHGPSCQVLSEENLRRAHHLAEEHDAGGSPHICSTGIAVSREARP